MKKYHYVGPEKIRQLCGSKNRGELINSIAALSTWLFPKTRGQSIVTFVVEQNGELRIADRRSEHVACAGGNPILSAGEMTFDLDEESIEVSAVSNQSTGYCPEPTSWHAVELSLDSLQISHPGSFTTEIIFRRCVTCAQRNIVKDNWFECEICDSPLPREWNFQTEV